MSKKITKYIPPQIKYFLKSYSNIHIKNKESNVFLFSVPRAGSTWLMELIASQPGFKYYDEPFNIRRENVKDAGYFRDWQDLNIDNNNENEILSYLKLLENNKLKLMNPPPFRRNHRIFTNRIVFKIHAIEHLVGKIESELNGKVIILLRHPIANTISRNQLPRLKYFAENEKSLRKYLSIQQINIIKDIFVKANKFEMGIISWCLQNHLLLMNSDKKNLIIITYEELLLNPEKSCKFLAEKLKLPSLQKLLKSVSIPAQNITISDKSTLDIMQSDMMDKNKKLVSKWKNKISQEEEKKAFDIINTFGINIYSKDKFIANSEYLNFQDTKF